MTFSLIRSGKFYTFLWFYCQFLNIYRIFLVLILKIFHKWCQIRRFPNMNLTTWLTDVYATVCRRVRERDFCLHHEKIMRIPRWKMDFLLNFQLFVQVLSGIVFTRVIYVTDSLNFQQISLEFLIFFLNEFFFQSKIEKIRKFEWRQRRMCCNYPSEYNEKITIFLHIQNGFWCHG